MARSDMTLVPRFERTKSLISGFTVVPPKGSGVTMQDLGRVLIYCKRHVPGWGIEFAQKRNGVFQWRNENYEMCVIESLDLKMPFIIDNKPAEDYEQDDLLREGRDRVVFRFRDDSCDNEMEKLFVLSKVLHELGFQTVDWIYLSDSAK